MNDLFLRACRRQPVERTPIWLMRQAGRSLPEYREVRQRVDFVTLYRTPELAAEVSLQPLDRLGVDAVIFFSDILVPAESMGLRVEFVPGPVVDRPVRDSSDVERLRTAEPEETVPFAFETLRILSRELKVRVPLIGFGASPFTLAAYLVEGKGSKSFGRIKAMLYDDPSSAHRLLEKITDVTGAYLCAQVKAGAQAIQLFDTWAGLMDRAGYREFVLPYVKRVLDRLAPVGVPRIYFALDAAHLMEDVRNCGADVIGVDWRLSLTDAARLLGAGYALQGNLDPAVLLSNPEAIGRRATSILEQARDLEGHVFNLGHGVLPETPVEHLQALVDAVKGQRRAS